MLKNVHFPRKGHVIGYTLVVNFILEDNAMYMYMFPVLNGCHPVSCSCVCMWYMYVLYQLVRGITTLHKTHTYYYIKTLSLQLTPLSNVFFTFNCTCELFTSIFHRGSHGNGCINLLFLAQREPQLLQAALLLYIEPSSCK